VRSIKYERLNRMIPFGERHLGRTIAEFVRYYHRERNHQGLENERSTPHLPWQNLLAAFSGDLGQRRDALRRRGDTDILRAQRRSNAEQSFLEFLRRDRFQEKSRADLFSLGTKHRIIESSHRDHGHAGIEFPGEVNQVKAVERSDSDVNQHGIRVDTRQQPIARVIKFVKRHYRVSPARNQGPDGRQQFDVVINDHDAILN
jgi:hypothetical protein